LIETVVGEMSFINRFDCQNISK